MGKNEDDLIKALQGGFMKITAMRTRMSQFGVKIIDIELTDAQPQMQTAVPPPLALTPYFSTQKGWSPNTMAPPLSKPKTIAEQHGVLDIGDGTEPIIGFRDFIVINVVNQGATLMSRNQALWGHRQKHVATCGANTPLSPHDPPHPSCMCGIYAYDAPTHKNLKQDDVCWAEVALWGDVYICETGYRAEFGYPLSLFLKDTGTKNCRRVQADLERNYGVPVFLVAEREGKTAADVMGEMIAQGLMLEHKFREAQEDDGA